MYVGLYVCIHMSENVCMYVEMYICICTHEDTPMSQRRILCALFHRSSPSLLETGRLTEPGAWPLGPRLTVQQAQRSSCLHPFHP